MEPEDKKIADALRDKISQMSEVALSQDINNYREFLNAVRNRQELESPFRGRTATEVTASE
jgi:hypothetical protein